MFKKQFIWFVVLLACAALWGCGSGGSSSGGSDAVVDGGSVENLATLGVLNCVKCHSSTSPETLSWLKSAHGNSNGSMRYGDPRGPHDETSSCQPCHNQLLDGDKMDQAFTDIDISEAQDGSILASGDRDIVTCESCHGPGSAHRGVGPIPYARPDWEQCVACHDHGEGVRHADDHGLLASSVGASAHNNSDNLHASSAKCQRCHTAEGAAAFTAYTGDKNVMSQMDDVASLGAEEDLHPVTCAACHVPHDDSGRWENFIVNNNDVVSGNWDPNGNGVADQFDFCTSCHNYYNQDGVLVGSGSVASGTAPFYHNTAWYRTITSTHYDNPATLTGQGNEDLTAVPPVINKIEGYVIRQTVDGVANSDPCFDCHGHELRANTRHADDLDGSDADHTATPHNGWARSGHGGKLLDNVFAAVDLIDCTDSPTLSHGRCEEQADAAMAAYTSDTTGGVAWSHYDWDDTDGNGPDGLGASSRSSCQECHTATGAMNYLNDPTNYDAANNDFSHLSGWVAGTTSSPQNEMLYCWGCHSNAGTGVLRNPGATSRPYTVGGVAVTMPDVGNSNVCINCHGARGNVEEYALTADPATEGDVNDPATDMSALKPGFGPSTKNVTEAHYLVASATIYAADSKIGYEYSGQDYAPKSYFAHGDVGLNLDSPETGSGPCAACHMETDDPHTFEVVEKSAAGVITALNSTSCVECHTGGHGAGLVVEDTTTDNGLQTAAAAAAFLEAEAEGYHEALEILNQALISKGLTFSANYPYFSGASWINEGTFGAAHNYNYLHHEPGAYAHNRYYAKRLIFDSIDWLDNGVLDGVITIDTVTYPEADHWLASGASRP